MLALQMMQKFNIYTAVCDSAQREKTFYSAGAATKAVSHHSCFFNIIYLIGRDLDDFVSARMIFTMFCDK